MTTRWTLQIGRSEKEKINRCEQRIHHEAFNIFLEVNG
jgi:hypothetical protein